MMEAMFTPQPTSLMKDTSYEHATCGMHPELVAELRLALAEGTARSLCASLASRVSGVSVVVVVAPPIGPITCFSSNAHNDTFGASPTVVIWLLLDSLDIDSKQTTFVKAREPLLPDIMKRLYRSHISMESLIFEKHNSPEASTIDQCEVAGVESWIEHISKAVKETMIEKELPAALLPLDGGNARLLIGFVCWAREYDLYSF
jgi:hypothetical protein